MKNNKTFPIEEYYERNDMPAIFFDLTVLDQHNNVIVLSSEKKLLLELIKILLDDNDISITKVSNEGWIFPAKS